MNALVDAVVADMEQSERISIMTNKELFEALEKGFTEFIHVKSSKIYSVEPGQRYLLEFGDAAVMAYPVAPKPRGRYWQLVSPRNLRLHTP